MSLLKRLDQKVALFFFIAFLQNPLCQPPFTGWYHEQILVVFRQVSSVNTLHFQGSKRQSKLNQNFNGFSFLSHVARPHWANLQRGQTLLSHLTCCLFSSFLSAASFPSLVVVRGGKIKGKGQSVMLEARAAGIRWKCSLPGRCPNVAFSF